MNYYDVLKVSREASMEEVKKAFRKLAIEHHPDKNTGNKESEEMFKSINEAYNVISDPEKRKMYDQFGTVDGPGMPPGGMDLNDMLKNMFGAGMGMPGGFSFVFGEGGDDFGHGFPFGGGGPRGGHRKHVHEADIVEIVVDINDIYYGNTKCVEFEILDKCEKCNGLGAQDPSGVVSCITCNGQGHIVQQLAPFFVQKMTCPSCQGKGQTIKQNKMCQQCKGEKAMFKKRVFQLIIPKGIPDRHEVNMEKKGSFMPDKGIHKDMIFKFKHDIQPPYSLDSHGNVTLTLDVTIEELMAGFSKPITLYQDSIVVKSDHYFNPTKMVVIKEKGTYNIKKQKQTDLFVKFNVVFTDGERLIKYHEVIHKVLKKQVPNHTPSPSQDVIHIQASLSSS